MGTTSLLSVDLSTCPFLHPSVIDMLARLTWLFACLLDHSYQTTELLILMKKLFQESHVDRGDTQRAIAVYRDIAVCIILPVLAHLIESQMTKHEFSPRLGQLPFCVAKNAPHVFFF